MAFNNMIFNEILKRGYKEEGKIRVWDISDSKLWYLTSKQSQKFLDMEKDKSYKRAIIKTEVDLIKNNFSSIIEEMKAQAYNIIDIGCGDGKKASQFISKFSNNFNIRYCPIDISPYMIQKALKNIRKLKIGDILESNWNISDFENLDNVTLLFRNPIFKNHFMLFLGNTMGNFASNNILQAIRKSMKKGDFLLIGNGIFKKVNDELINAYYNRSTIDFLIQLILLIGFESKDVEYNVRFVNYRIEVCFKVLVNKTIEHFGKKLEFKKDDLIIAGISYKYTKSELKSILNKFFPKVRLFYNSKETYALALCSV